MQVTQEQYSLLDDRISKVIKLENKNIELETIFTPESIKINRYTFEKLISRLKGLNLMEYPEVETLDINCQSSDIRVSIKGLDNIKEYCNTNSIGNIEDIVYIRKKKYSDENGIVKPIDLSEYDIRINLKSEMIIDKDHSDITELISNIEKQKKFFRLKKRISFITEDNLFRYDLTILKESESPKNAINLLNSNILSSELKYEVELEFIGEIDESTQKEDILNKNIHYSGIILQTLQSSDFIITKTEKDQIIADYINLIGNKFMGKTNQIDRKNFIGPQPVSIELSHIREYEDDIPTIRKNYSVTEKTDGERYLMYINNVGKCYLINNRFHVLYLGLGASSLKNSILDGEYVLYDKYDNYNPCYFIFDLYFINGNDIRHLPLFDTNEDSRLSNLDYNLKGLQWEPLEEQSNILKIEKKQFYYGNRDKCGKLIFEHCNKILSKVHSDMFEYKTDGLIFTPINLGVGALFNGTFDKNKTGLTWDLNLKWKPPHENTIDFLVEVVQEKNNSTGSLEDKVSYLYDSGSDIIKYKTLKLKCGFDPSKNIQYTCDDLLNNKHISKIRKHAYYPIEFKPSSPPDEDAHICYIKLEKDSDGNDRMLTSQNEEITTNMIVEMSYDSEQLTHWKWKARNIRYDKTEQYNRGDKQFGNPFHVANNIWKTIHNPITNEMISTGDNLPDICEEETRYYARIIPREKSLTKSMLDFHNIYIKLRLFKSLGRQTEGGSLLEIGCGKGGDISKWKDGNFTFVLGIDNNKDNIENSKDGACQRYFDIKSRCGDKLPRTVFVWADATKPFITPSLNDNAGLDQNNSNILNLLWGKNDIQNVQPEQKDLWGICSSHFDVISCQFAIHYFFKDKPTLDNVIRNISENTKENGFFMGTCFDGDYLHKSLHELKFNEFLIGKDLSKVLWRIKKCYQLDQPVLPNDDTSLGLEIQVLIETINQTFSEYLVNFKYFESLMNERGMYLITHDLAHEMGFPNPSGLFSELFAQLEVESTKHNYSGDALNMTETQKLLSFFNRYFIFQKKPIVTNKQPKKKKLKIVETHTPL